MIVTVDETDFNKLSLETTIVYFWAAWCGPCKQLSPVMEVLSNKYTDISFIKVDVDNLPLVAQDFGITSVPTLLLFKTGELVKTIVGAKVKSVLIKELEAVYR